MSDRPRFLLTFLAWAKGLAGGDRHLLEVAAHWREHVDLVVLAPAEALPTIHSFVGDIPAQALGGLGARRSNGGAALAAEYVRRSVTARIATLPDADVVVSASHFAVDATALVALARKGAFGVAYVYHLVAARPGHDLRTVWSKTDERVGLRLLRKNAGLVFASNSETIQALRRRGFDPVHTSVGVDVAAFTNGTERPQEPRGLFVARMTRPKGVTDAVEAWASVRRRVPGARLVMVGTGPEEEGARALAGRLGIGDAIEWRGFVTEEEKRRLLGRSTLLLAPSYEEGWGISVCEALASSLPVVAYRLPVLDELFGSAYLGAPRGDVSKLAELALDVIGDDALATRLAAAGVETAARYDVAQVAQEELAAITSRLPCAS